MENNTKLRFNVNPNALVKTISLVSNTVLLTANAFLVGSRFSNYFKEQKRERVVSNLQITAEIASAAASLAKVVTDTLERYHARD
ncbi:MAG: hypothetical protein CV087_21765 [Candidatus Brocadia sp. WS118]|nr:MAG: hypothetical protein CV087_21765 [Candidatus Brocadia sp. WS118]